MTHFSFITDKILQANLDVAFDHIVKLTTISESKEEKYKGMILVSSLRKTIIIHIAAIIEALLLWKLRQICQTQQIELEDEWKYTDIRILYTLTDSTEIIAGLRKKEKKELEKLDFDRITKLCHHHKIIKSNRLKENIDKVRAFRNRLHIGGLPEIEKEYTKVDLEFCFKVAVKVESLVSKK